jgi:hypothetical protein
LTELTPGGDGGNQTTQVVFNATAAQVADAFEGLFGLTADDFYVTSSTAGETAGGQLPTDVLDITVPEGFTLSVSSYTGLTGGTSPTAVVALVSSGTGT